MTNLQRTAMSNLVGLRFTFQYKRDIENGAANALSHACNILFVDALMVWQPGCMQGITNSYETDAFASFCQASFASTGVYGLDATPLQAKLVSTLHNNVVGSHFGLA